MRRNRCNPNGDATVDTHKNTVVSINSKEASFALSGDLSRLAHSFNSFMGELSSLTPIGQSSPL